MENNNFYDKEFRDKIRTLDRKTLAQLQADVYQSDKVEVRILTNTRRRIYFAIPHNTNTGVDLSTLQAGVGKEAGSLGCLTTLSTIGCACSTASSGACVGTVSSADVANIAR